MVLTGNLDVDRLIVAYLNDEDILKIYKLNKYTYEKVCNETFFRNLVYTRYQNTIKYKDYVKTKSWKNYYFNIVYYIDKLKNKHKVDYNNLKNTSPEMEYLTCELYNNFYAINPSLKFKMSENMYFLIIKYIYEKKGVIPCYKELFNFACENGYLHLVKYFVSIGINVGKSSGLMSASENGHLEVVEFLVESGANIHFGQDYSLKWACHNGHLEVVKYLTEKGADIHSDSCLSLTLAAEKGHLPVVEFLVEKGAIIYANNPKILTLAIRNEHSPVLEYLIEKRAIIDSKNIKICSRK